MSIEVNSFFEGWRMVKSETRRDAEILVRNPSPRLFGKKFRDSKKVNTNHAKTRLRDFSKTLPRFRDPAKIFRDPRFSRYHSPPLLWNNKEITIENKSIFWAPLFEKGICLVQDLLDETGNSGPLMIYKLNITFT